MCLRAGRCGVHTLFFLALVSVFSLLAVLFMCVRVCVVRPFGALPRIVNILARHTVVSSWLVNVRLFAFSLFPLCPWPPHTFCAFVDFFFFLAAVGAYGGINMGDIWLWFVFAGVPFDVRGGSSFFFFFLRAVLSLGRPPSQHTWFSHPRMCSGGYDMYDAWGRNILGCHTSFSRGPWSRLFCLWFGVSLFVAFPSLLFFFFDAHMSPSSYGKHFARWLGARFVLVFVVVACWFLVFASFLLLCLWSAHKSLAPRIRTLLGVLEHATHRFFAVATLLFVFVL